MAAPPLTFDGCFPPALPDSKIYKHTHMRQIQYATKHNLNKANAT